MGGVESNGRVVWHDCMTTDIDKSVDFYSKLFGWEIKDVDMGGVDGHPPYKMIHAGEAGIGGFVQVKADDDVPTRWVAYVAVDDIDAACKRATTGGGKVAVPPQDIPNVGKFSIIVDPQGGMIAPYQSATDLGPEPEGPNPVGQFIWEEMMAKDPAAAAGYYAELFGWKSQEMDMGEMGTYRIQMRGETPEAGIMAMPPGADKPSWLSYVHVEDVDKWAAQVNELGGKTVMEPMSIPNVGRMSVHIDPCGSAFALYKPDKTTCD